MNSSMAAKQNKCLLLRKKDDMVVEDAPYPTPKSHEVIVNVKAVGICGSDVHYWTHGRIGDFVVKAPMILGHESSGIVVEVGDSVTGLCVGDRVALEPGVPCRMCEFCKAGRYNLCPGVQFLATPPVHGSLANFHAHPEDFCFKIPDHVSYGEAAMLEPLSVGIHACRRAGISVGHTVLITGAGPIGLMALLAARSFGATTIIVSDINANRLSVAKDLGANFTHDVTSENSLKELVSAGSIPQPNVTIECSGAQSAITAAIRCTVSGGVVVLVGLGPPTASIPIVDAATREVDIRGIFRYANTYQTALSLVASGAIDVKPVITHTFSMENALDAFAMARDAADNAIKVVIEP